MGNVELLQPRSRRSAIFPRRASRSPVRSELHAHLTSDSPLYKRVSPIRYEPSPNPRKGQLTERRRLDQSTSYWMERSREVPSLVSSNENRQRMKEEDRD
ncbi:unnamed protein product [Sphagnum balticum]